MRVVALTVAKARSASVAELRKCWAQWGFFAEESRGAAQVKL